MHSMTIVFLLYPNGLRMPMPEIKINPWKNRLYITFREWNQADMPNYVDRVEGACNELIPGFSCLTVVLNRRGVRAKDRNLLFNTTELISAYGASFAVWVYKNAYRSRLNGNPARQIRIPVAIAPDIKSAESILDSQTDYTVAHEMDYMVFRALNRKGETQLVLNR